eukprot:gene3783-biopygen124
MRGRTDKAYWTSLGRPRIYRSAFRNGDPEYLWGAACCRRAPHPHPPPRSCIPPKILRIPHRLLLRGIVQHRQRGGGGCAEAWRQRRCQRIYRQGRRQGGALTTGVGHTPAPRLVQIPGNGAGGRRLAQAGGAADALRIPGRLIGSWGVGISTAGKHA